MSPLLPLLVALAAAAPAPPAPPPAPAGWAATLDAVAPAVVSIRMDRSRAFDTQGPGNSYATGFIVDAERGLLLTNRHVIGPGPGRAEAVLLNNEEVPLTVAYIDPVHDFGLYRFRPADVRHLRLRALPLHPEGAQVGVEVKVLGNDAGEKLSILSGTLARIDRAAPDYGRGRYTDFNTFYIQAASSTSGGSSGSPVVDAMGRVVALNAGSRSSAASSYYLPLDRVVRALALVQSGQPVSRGTLQVSFEHRPFDALRRLGLRDDEEARARAEGAPFDGLLVADQVDVGGVGEGRLREGDVLLALEGARWPDFTALEAVLDERVGGEVAVSVARGAERLELRVPVADLHALTPRALVEAGGGVFHALSHQKARAFATPARGVFVAQSGYAFGDGGVPAGAVVTSLGGAPVPDLDAFWTQAQALADGARVPVRWFHLEEPTREQLSVVEWDRAWFPLRRCAARAEDGAWPCAAAPPAPARAAPTPARAVPLPARDRAARRLAPSLVTVDARIPYRVEGAHGGNFRGTGLIVDADRGWVLVDRDTVPVTLADVTLTFGGVAELPAEVVWLHPAHNLGVVRYDPALLVDSPFRAARLGAAPPADGARIWHVGLDRSDQVVSKRTRVDRANPVSIGLPRSPTFRDANLDVLDPESAAESTGGALADRRGRVVALWASFVDLSGEEADAWFRGLPVDVVAEALDALRAGAADPWPTPGLELGAVDLSTARDLGLSEARAAALTAADPARRQALGVERLRHGSPAAERLKIGDLLLSVDGAPLTRARQLELALRGDGVAALEVLRDGAELPVELPATPAPAAELDRALLWGGALLHATPQWAPAQRGAPAVGAYVAWVWSGSPASRDGLRGTFRVVAVGDREVATLDDFARAVQGLTGDVRLRALDLEGRPQVLTLKLDAEAWPAAELIRGPGGWRRVDPAR